MRMSVNLMDVINLRKLVYRVRIILVKRFYPDATEDFNAVFFKLRTEVPHSLFQGITPEAVGILNLDLTDFSEVAHNATDKSKDSIAQSVSNQRSRGWMDLFQMAFADAEVIPHAQEGIRNVQQYLDFHKTISYS